VTLQEASKRRVERLRPAAGSGLPGRWLAFNAVGWVGAAVQLGVLFVLTHAAGIPTPMATAVAVEAAILHNFLGHQRWTWRDRPSAGPRETISRLARFHAYNGVVSLVGNILITSALARAGVDPVLANLAAIVACSLVNFGTGEWIVFRPLLGFVAIGSLLTGAAPAAAQSSAAIKGWDAYVAAVERRYADEKGTFFALDVLDAKRWRDRARAGEIPMREADPPSVADAKLHHWVGAVYVPDTTVDAVVKKIQDHAGAESKFYGEVKASKLLERSGDRFRVFMRIERDASILTATYNTEHAVEYRRRGPTRASSRSLATRIAELADAGTPREREKAAGEDHGFLWRLNAYWRFEQAGDGVLIECESVSLSRSVPFVVRPLVGPIANRIARESLETTLRSLKRFMVSP
jgi:putative flippase GtrA